MAGEPVGVAVAKVGPTRREIMDAAMRRPVYVRWVDSCGAHRWATIDDLHNDIRPTEIVTMGFVVRDDDEALTLAMSLDPDNGNADGIIAIPKVAVLEVWEIED